MGDLIRQKRKPPKGERCDCHVGLDSTGPSPVVIRCDREATVEFKGGPFPFETWTCDECAELIEKKQARTALSQASVEAKETT